MKIVNKKIKKILILLFITICTILYFKLKNGDIKISNNTKSLEKILSSSLNNKYNTCKYLFDFDYDKVYVFQPYLSKYEMEKEIGFKYRKLKETVNECMVNMLFVKNNKPVVYLYGYPSDLGSYIEMPIGEYKKSDLDKAEYSVEKIKIGNSYNNEKTYIKYTINLEK